MIETTKFAIQGRLFCELPSAQPVKVLKFGIEMTLLTI